MSDFTCVSPAGDRCGEALVWSAREGALYWTDINRFLIHRHDCLSRCTRSWFFDEPVVALSLTSRTDTMLVALAGKLILWRPRDDSRQDYGVRLDDYPQVRINEGRADPRGDFWFGTMRNNVLPNGELCEAGPGRGKLWQVRAEDGRCQVWRRGVGIANTVCWNPQRTRFYFGDTLENCIWAYDYDASSGSVSNPRVFFAGYERGYPDGSSVDEEGYLWNCRYGGACIVRVSPGGRVDRVLETPVSNPTTCTFGGADRKTLYFASAANQAAQGDRLAGSVFALPVAVAGQAENRFRLTPA